MAMPSRTPAAVMLRSTASSLRLSRHNRQPSCFQMMFAAALSSDVVVGGRCLTPTLYRAFMTDDHGLALARDRGARWLPARRVHSLEEAAGFVETVGIALLFPADRVTAPSLWEAVA